MGSAGIAVIGWLIRVDEGAGRALPADGLAAAGGSTAIVGGGRVRRTVAAAWPFARVCADRIRRIVGRRHDGLHDDAVGLASVCRGAVNLEESAEFRPLTFQTGWGPGSGRGRSW